MELPGARQRRRRRDVLPVAAIARGSREASQRHGAPRPGRRFAFVEGGRPAWSRARPPRLGLRLAESSRRGRLARLGLVVGPGAALPSIQSRSSGGPDRDLRATAARPEPARRFCPPPPPAGALG